MNRTVLFGALLLALSAIPALPAVAAAAPGACDVVSCEAVGYFVRTGPGYACLAIAPEYGGTMTCAFPSAGCVAHHGGAFRESVCVPTVLEMLTGTNDVGAVCIPVAPQYGGTMTCVGNGCVSHHGGVVREEVCLAAILP